MSNTHGSFTLGGNVYAPPPDRAASVDAVVKAIMKQLKEEAAMGLEEDVAAIVRARVLNNQTSNKATAGVSEVDIKQEDIVEK